MSKSPLFNAFNSNKKQDSNLSRLLPGPVRTVTREVMRATRQAQREGYSIRSQVEKGLRIDPNAIQRRMRNTGLGKLARDIERYKSGGGALGMLAKQFLSSLGPVGNLINALASAVGRTGTRFERDMDATSSLLGAFGVDATDLDKMPLGDVINRAELLERHLAERGRAAGNDSSRPGKTGAGQHGHGPQGGLADGLNDTTTRGQRRPKVELADSDGIRREYDIASPVVTGDETFVELMSEHVYSYSYQYDTSTLFVRYQQYENGRRGGPGTAYEYYDISPEQFRALVNAPRKGVWIWDELRVRGSHQHQKNYQLTRWVNGYIPRQATTGYHDGMRADIYKPRNIEVAGGQWVKSDLSTQVVRTYGRGTAPDGAPNRGAANNGRRR